jgi:hypothetical protein
MKRQHIDKYIADVKHVFHARFAEAAADPKIERAFTGFARVLTNLTGARYILTLPPVHKTQTKKKALTLPPLKPKARKRRAKKKGSLPSRVEPKSRPSRPG